MNAREREGGNAQEGANEREGEKQAVQIESDVATRDIVFFPQSTAVLSNNCITVCKLTSILKT